MSKFTPGPWKLWEADSEHWWICESLKEERHSHFAKISVGNFWQDEGKANAYLISAAPDMYEALQIAFAGTHELGNFPNERAHEYFRTILAKADGK